MRRKKDNANIFKGTKKRIKGLPMQASAWAHINSNRGRGDVNE